MPKIKAEVPSEAADTAQAIEGDTQGETCVLEEAAEVIEEIAKDEEEEKAA